MNSGRQHCALAVLALFLAAPLVLAAAAAQKTVQKVVLAAPSADSARIVLNLSAVPARKVFTLANPDRIVIDLPDTRLASGLRLPQSAGPVRAFRSGAHGKSLRLVVELSRKLDPVVSISGSQLTIDIGPVASSSATSVSTPEPVAPVRAAHAPEDNGREVIVAVDAGHGGDDPGALGASGTREKDVVLAIAHALAKRIDAEPGMRAYMTRKDDTRIPLRDRMSLADRAHADIFVSVHADSIANRSVAGSSVYILNEKGASSEAARLLADQENAVDLKRGGKPDQVLSVLMNMSQTASKRDSMEVAAQVLSQLDQVGIIRKTRVQQANFMVLKLPDIPSILVETAYISNPGEEKKLRDPKHQAAIAEAIFNGVRAQLRSNPPDGSLFAQQRGSRQSTATQMVADSTGP